MTTLDLDVQAQGETLLSLSHDGTLRMAANVFADQARDIYIAPGTSVYTAMSLLFSGLDSRSIETVAIDDPRCEAAIDAGLIELHWSAGGAP